MNPQKAKEELTIQTTSFAARNNPNHRNALKLGIEALSLYQLLKATGDIPETTRLPGETEE